MSLQSTMSKFKLIQVKQREHVAEDNYVVSTKEVWFLGCFLIYWRQMSKP